MKHSKAFLVSTSCLLTIAGIAATKTQRFGHIYSDYYDQLLKRCYAYGCIPATETFTQGINIYRGIVGAHVYTFYTHNLIVPCSHVLYTDIE